MPQRRSFAPVPMNKPDTGNTGRQATPPNLSPGAQPLPPGPLTSQPQTNVQSAQGATPQRPPLPMSIPLRAPAPAAPLMPQAPAGGGGGAMPQPMAAPMRPGTGTVTPFNVDPMLDASKTGENGAPGDGPMGSTLLKLLAAFGHTGSPDDANA